jgi:hypothetical protein
MPSVPLGRDWSLHLSSVHSQKDDALSNFPRPDDPSSQVDRMYLGALKFEMSVPSCPTFDVESRIVPLCPACSNEDSEDGREKLSRIEPTEAESSRMTTQYRGRRHEGQTVATLASRFKPSFEGHGNLRFTDLNIESGGF